MSREFECEAAPLLTHSEEHGVEDKPTFVAKFFSRDDMTSVTLPYGILCGDLNGEDLSAASTSKHVNTSTEDVTAAIFNDCVAYIKAIATGSGNFEWYHDFIAFTNLQTVIYNNSDLLHEGEDLDLILEYTNKHIRNLRSSVARNALMFVACIVECSTHNNTLLLTIAVKLMPQLFKCCTSEKAVYRNPAIENLNSICEKCHRLEFIDLAWVLMKHACDRNAKICSAATRCLLTFFDNLSDKELLEVDRKVLSEHLEPCMGGKNAQTRELCSKLIFRVVALISPEDAKIWWSESKPTSRLAKLLKSHPKVVTSTDAQTESPNEIQATPTKAASTGEMETTETMEKTRDSEESMIEKPVCAVNAASAGEMDNEVTVIDAVTSG
ncbi:uncharacterized protein BXIN_1955 [Babesia sp. Xinjiang]|uniref:uncharacterized protein n=1 Tax=Babesia sp. Xinjiang TaxID=462227 RepID=UPI000A21A1E9|nr:uncharacterized protein BXIN_1955 [Babesia sp. Xinjiang]ORM40463.1 hypothetical protein BXIN_1955 [Babesia sp. Xinjiang]